MRARDLAVAFDGRPVLDGVSLEVAAGETLAVMGANGAGKTTLLRCLAGLAEPDAGTVEAAGVVGFAPEDPTAALFAATVADEVAFFPRNRGLDAEAAAAEAMRTLDVEGLRDRNPRTLSFGEQRRVALASVLAGDPATLVLDEPTSGLDREGARELGRVLAALETAVVLSTHRSDFAYAFADRVAVLVDGRVERCGPARAVLADLDLLRTAGIRPPGLVAWAADRGFDRVPVDLDDAVAMARGES